MSELQAYDSERIYWAVEQVEREAGDIDGLHLDDSLFYIKSEADKEIEFWKKASHDHYERWFNLNKQYEGWFGKVMRCERAERELRHHKYKRCLAMAKYCDASMAYFNEFYDDASKRMVDHYYKWRSRWYELAEKFKPEGK